MACEIRLQSAAALSGRGAVPERATLKRLIVRAARVTLRHHAVTTADISITLLDDDEIAAMNREFLHHDGPTDVISFALYEDGEPPVGDIYIGYVQAERQAEAVGVPAREEVARLTVHGVLHVLGHEHPEGEGRFDSRMWAVQEDIVARVLTE